MTRTSLTGCLSFILPGRPCLASPRTVQRRATDLHISIPCSEVVFRGPGGTRSASLARHSPRKSGRGGVSSILRSHPIPIRGRTFFQPDGPAYCASPTICRVASPHFVTCPSKVHRKKYELRLPFGPKLTFPRQRLKLTRIRSVYSFSPMR